MASTAKDSYPSATAIEASPHILTLLTRLHKESLDQEYELKGNPQMAALRSKPDEDHRKALMADKFIALDADKAAFMYALVRAMGATHVVEVGTSYGVSTIYLALAVGQNAKGGKKGRVVATEHEPAKAKRARAYWRECGKDVEEVVELKEGDLRETLKTVDGQQTEKVDFVLVDIWTPMVVPALEILEPQLRPGAVILCDNVTASKEGYKDFFAMIKGPGSRYKTVTLPFEGGLEMVTYCP